jgi:hypothetical protein
MAGARSVMRQWGISLCLLATLVVATGCTGKPPVPRLVAGDVKIPFTQGSYCWRGALGGICADAPPLPYLLKELKVVPAELHPGAKIRVNFGDQPNSIRVEKVDSLDTPSTEVTLASDGTFEVPREAGVYTYILSVKWKQGSASYVFQVAIKH